nr:RNA polymerase beta' subunit [Follicularia botryoides]
MSNHLTKFADLLSNFLKKQNSQIELQKNSSKVFKGTKHAKFYTSYCKISEIRYVSIGLASSQTIRKWAEKTLPNGKVLGEVTSANTLHHRSFKPLKGGLFCERIFGPLKDFECACGIQKRPSQEEYEKILEHQQIQRKFCSTCDVEYTWSIIRRYQMGYIQLVTPVTHLWYLKANPSYLSILLDFRKNQLESIIYCSQTLTLENSTKVVQNFHFSSSASDLFISWQNLLNNKNSNLTKNLKELKANYINKSIDQQDSESRIAIKTKQNKKNMEKNKAICLADNLTAKKLSNKTFFQTFVSNRVYLLIKTLDNLESSKLLWLQTLFAKEAKNKEDVSVADRQQSQILVSNNQLTGKFTGQFDYLNPFVCAEAHLYNSANQLFVPQYKVKQEELQNLFKSFMISSFRKFYKQIYILSHLRFAKQTNQFFTNKLQKQIYCSFNSSISDLQNLNMTSNQNLCTRTRTTSNFLEVVLLNLQTKFQNQAAHKINLWKIVKFLQKTHDFCSLNKLIAQTARQNSDLIFNLKFDFQFEFKNQNSQKLPLKNQYIVSKSFLFFLHKRAQTANHFAIQNTKSKCNSKKQQFWQKVNKIIQIAVKRFLFLKFKKTNPFASTAVEILNPANQQQFDLQSWRKASLYASTNKKKQADFLLSVAHQLDPQMLKKIKLFSQLLSNQLFGLFLKFGLNKTFVNIVTKYVDLFKNRELKKPKPFDLLMSDLLCLRSREAVSKKEQGMDLPGSANKNKQIISCTSLQSHQLRIYLHNKSQFLTCRSYSQANKASSAVITKTKSFVKNQIQCKFQNNLVSSLFANKQVTLKRAQFIWKFASFLCAKEEHQNQQKLANLLQSCKTDYKNSVKKKSLKSVINKNHFPVTQLKTTIFASSYKPKMAKKRSFIKGTLNSQPLIQKDLKIGLFEKNQNSFVVSSADQTAWYSVATSKKQKKLQYEFQYELKCQSRLARSLYVVFKKILKKRTDYCAKKYKQIQKNHLYCVSYRELWRQDKEWHYFSYYSLAPCNFDDLRLPSDKFKAIDYQNFETLHVNQTGAAVIEKLLFELDSNELQNIDRQNRRFLDEFNKGIGLLKTFVAKGFAEKSEIKELKDLCKKRDQLIRKTKLIRKLFLKKTKVTSMLLTTLPVLPPDLRPILKMQDQIAASDLNRLYQRVIYRNDRLKRFRQDLALNHSFEIRYAQRLLQEAVDNLIQNGKGGVTPERDSGGRSLKSLSEILKGKQGRFRQYLLGKRVDYSGRSVIVVGPKLQIHQCGLPKEIAIELYLPFLIQRILHYGFARTVIGAKTLIQSNHPKQANLCLSLLSELMQTHPIFLNRAPTLHRLGIQAFQPKLVEGRAILLHPLVCPAFNADFDGDQMAVHLPLTVEARAEAWKLMFAPNHLISAATGEPLLLPSQDMVLGCYYLTNEVLKIKKPLALLKNYNDLSDFSDSKSLCLYVDTNFFASALHKPENFKSQSFGKQNTKTIQSVFAQQKYAQKLQQTSVVKQKQIDVNRFCFANIYDFLVKRRQQKAATTSLFNRYFNHFGQVRLAYDKQLLSVHSDIWVKWNVTSSAVQHKFQISKQTANQHISNLYYKNSEKDPERQISQANSNKLLLNKTDLSSNMPKFFTALTELSRQKQPIEFRLHLDGCWQELRLKEVRRFNHNNLKLSHYVRTTPGRILFYELIQDCLKSA